MLSEFLNTRFGLDGTMQGERTSSGIKPQTVEELSEGEMGRVADFIQYLSEENRLYVFSYLREGASEYLLERALVDEPDDVMSKRALQRHLNSFRDRGLIETREGTEMNPHTGEENDVEQIVLSPLGKKLEPMFPDFVAAASTIDTLSWVLGQLPREYWSHDVKSREEFIEKFQDATVTLDERGNHEAREAYRDRVYETVMDENQDPLEGEARVSEVKELATGGVVSPGDRVTGFSCYHIPIMDYGLEATFIHSKSLVDRLDERGDWRSEAVEHQNAGVEESEDPPLDERQVVYYGVDYDVPLTLTIFGDKSVGVFVDVRENRGVYLHCESSEAVKWAEKEFQRHITEASLKRYRPPK